MEESFQYLQREEIYDEVQAKRGRPAGKTDSSNIYIHTAQEVSNDKVSVAQMKLDAMKESEALKLTRKPTPLSPQIKSEHSRDMHQREGGIS